MVKGLYERVFASRVDRVWVVSQPDARAIRRVMRYPAVDCITTGVDTNHFAPQAVEQKPASCTLWGRLDFGPNVDAVRWFASEIWPEIRRRRPEATFTLYGFQPTPEMDDIGRRSGFEIVPDLNDLREAVCRHQVVVLPFVSGAGIKNKLLEAASMGRPILASPKAVNGLPTTTPHPFQVVHSRSQWVDALEQLWNDERLRTQRGAQARAWVIENASWHTAARQVTSPLSD